MLHRHEEGETPIGTKSHDEAPSTVAGEVFWSFPYGLLVVDEGGGVETCNSAARRLLGEVPPGSTCCSLLGCRSPEGPLAENCFAKLARGHGEVLPEVRVDLPVGRPEYALWVTAAPLETDRSRVILQLRSGEVRDRRRRTEPHWLAAPELQIHTFGRTRVRSREGSIGGRWLERRPGQILKYLVCERDRVVHTDEIAESIWPDRALHAAGSVRYFIHALRQKLEPERPKRAPSSFVISRNGGYTLNSDTVRIDAGEFEEKVSAGLSAFDRSSHDVAAATLEEAVALYSGDFLADERYSEWALAERDRLRSLVSDALRALAGLRLQADDPGAALEFVERLASLQPLDPDVQRQLIALLMARGRRSDAVRRYQRVRRQMSEEFGHPPDFQLADVTPGEICLG